MSLEVMEDDDGGHFYMWDGKRVPGVSEVLAANDVLLKNAYYEERAAAAAARGSDVHMATVDCDRSMKTRWWDDVPEIHPYVFAWELFKNDFNFQAHYIEEPMFHKEFHYAGTPDRVGTIGMPGGERPVTLDIKCTSVIGCHVPLQLAGYNLFMDDWQTRQIVAVQLKPNGKYAAHWFEKEVGEAHRVFLAALTLTLWRDRYHKINLYT